MLLLAMIADVEAGSRDLFRVYEDMVLPLLGDYSGRLERRVRSDCEAVEIHLISFRDEVGYLRYLDDPRRLSARASLNGAEIQQRVLVVSDVG